MATSLSPIHYHQWTADDVARYFESKGYGEYSKQWKYHRLTGERVVMMGVDDLERMGFKCVGDKLGVQRELRQLKTAARNADHLKVIAKEKEAYTGSDFELWFRDGCCGCLCPREPDTYTLMRSVLKIRKYHVERFCGLKLGGCLGGQWQNNTIHLHNVNDVDTEYSTKGFGMFTEAKCKVLITAVAGNDSSSQMARMQHYELFLDKDKGLKFAQALQDQVYEFKMSLDGKHDHV